MPPATFIAASPLVSSRTSSITVQTPTATAAGDSLLCLFWTGETNDSKLDTTSLPPAWAVLSTLTEVGHGQQIILLRRLATDSEPATHTFSMIATGSGYSVCGVVLCYRGLDATAALVDAAFVIVNAPATLFACPSLTLATYSDLYLGFVVDHDPTEAATPPAGSTEHVDAPIPISIGHLASFDVHREVVGATGTQTATLSSPITQPGAAVAYALKALPPPLAPSITPDVAGAIGLVRIGV